MYICFRRRFFGQCKSSDYTGILPSFIELYLEQVDEVDGEDGSHPVVGEPLTGLHPNDEENSPARGLNQPKPTEGSLKICHQLLMKLFIANCHVHIAC